MTKKNIFASELSYLPWFFSWKALICLQSENAVTFEQTILVLTLRVQRKCFRNLLRHKEVSYEFTVLNELSDKRLVKSCFMFVGGLYFSVIS